MYRSLGVKINMHEKPHGARRSWTCFVCVCFQVRGRQKLEYPQLELHGMANDAITRGSIGDLGSLSISVDLQVPRYTSVINVSTVRNYIIFSKPLNINTCKPVS